MTDRLATPGKPDFDDDDDIEDRPNDFQGFEIISVLRTPGGRFRAGKSYKPDPSGQRTAVKASDYKLGEVFLCSLCWLETLEEFFECLQHWSKDCRAFLVRGHYRDFWDAPLQQNRVTKDIGYVVYRRSIKTRGEEGYFAECPRKLHMLDLDGVPLPDDMSIIGDPEECVTWAVDNLLPPEFRDVCFIYQLSASAALTKRDNELNAHLWFITDQSYGNEELRAWAKWWNAKQQCKILDPALYTAVQPHYVNEPELLDGLVDPLAGRRLGLVYRSKRTVHLNMPSAEEVSAELQVRQTRATTQYKKARKPESPETEKGSDAESLVSEGAEPDETGGPQAKADEGAGPYAEDAVRLGPGWRGYLRAIGFEGHIRTQILAAVGSYFFEHGSRADRDILRAAIAEAIEDTSFLDGGEPWSRSRADARGYLEASPGSRSNVEEMISDIARNQAKREQLASDPWAPAWEMPTLTAEEAYSEIEAAITTVLLDALKHRMRRLDPRDTDVVFETPPATAVNCSPGTGKTEAMVSSIAVFLALDDAARVLIAVPTHKLGEGLADRINRAYGSKIAAEWYGIEHADPVLPQEQMCRLAAAARELIAAGGKLELLCSHRGRQQTAYCPHHPKAAGAHGCGYKRQQSPDIAGKVRVWIVPATMLASPPPAALKRPTPGQFSDFDLLVIDEAPWFQLLPRHPLKIPVDWFAAGWWAAEECRAAEHQKQVAIEILGKIHSVLSQMPPGEVSAAELRTACITASEMAAARRCIWRYKDDLRKLVEPGTKPRRLKKALSAVGARNQRVLAVATALYGLLLHLDGRLAPSGVTLGDEAGRRYLYIRRRHEIHEAWLKAPTLYLDAADLSSFEIARAWLPGLELKVDARATAPHMRIVQLVETEMSYRKIVGGAGAEATVRENREKLVKVIRDLGPHGLVICPKQLRVDWERERALPDGWIVWNFGAIRGRDEAKSVSHLVVVSRPIADPAEVEMMAETIFAQRVQRLSTGEWYPKSLVGRLMADGTGRRALASRHPDPLVEAVRFALCEGELLQAVGRGRGVRRTSETPLDVLVLTNVPIPLPIDRLITWKELNDDGGPLRDLLARGVLPLDYAGMATALGGRFDSAAKVKDWFQYRPEARSALQSIRQRARRGDIVDLSEFSGIPHIESYIGDSAKLAVYRYRRARRQSNAVLVNGAMHPDARAAVEAVLGRLDGFEAANMSRARRPRRNAGLDVELEFFAMLLERGDPNKPVSANPLSSNPP